jgi:hypothetical protein
MSGRKRHDWKGLIQEWVLMKTREPLLSQAEFFRRKGITAPSGNRKIGKQMTMAWEESQQKALATVVERSGINLAEELERQFKASKTAFAVGARYILPRVGEDGREIPPPAIPGHFCRSLDAHAHRGRGHPGNHQNPHRRGAPAAPEACGRSHRMGPAQAEATREPVKIRFRLLPWQQQARELRARYPLVVVNCGVYTGKTIWGAAELLDDMLQHPGAKFWWVAGLKFQLEAMWEVFAPHVRTLGGRTKSHPFHYAELPNRAKVYGVSADNVEILSAHHPLAIYGDEVAKWKTQAWDLARIRLLNEQGCRGLFLSTPRPNFWRDLVRWGKTHKDNKWALAECNSFEAGLVPHQELEALRHDLTEELFNQEIMAQITDGAGGVFHNVLAAATGKVEVPEHGRTYCIGYDPAKVRDFAVAVVRQGDRVVYMERWKELAYLYQTQRVAHLAKYYNNAQVFLDAGGPGKPLEELLIKEGVRVVPEVFTNESKEERINALAVKLEKGLIQIPEARFGSPYSDLIDELTAFERRRTGSGLHYAYSAPDGGYDDCVCALLLTDRGKGKWKDWPL